MRRLTGVSIGVLLAFVFASNANAQTVDRWGLGIYTPAVVAGLAAPTVIEAGNGDGYAIEATGTVKAWGKGEYGALGDGNTKAQTKAVTVLVPEGCNAISLGEAELSGFALCTDGHVFDWGLDKEGDLCQGAGAGNLLTPREIEGLTEVVEVKGAEHNVLFRLADGEVDACGWNNKGQLGLGATGSVSVPTRVPGLTHVAEISEGPKVSLVRTESGEVLDTGTNVNGQLGQGAIHEETVFTPLALGAPASHVTAGGDGNENSHSCANVEGVWECWGFNEAGEDANGNETIQRTPVLATELSPLETQEVRAGGHGDAILTASGAVYTLGANTNGDLGLGESHGPSFAPLFVQGEVRRVSATATNILTLK